MTEEIVCLYQINVAEALLIKSRSGTVVVSRCCKDEMVSWVVDRLKLRVEAK